MRKSRRFVRLAALLASLGVLAGCGERDAKKVASQVAVRVNSEEVTVHQVNAVLETVRPIAAAEAAAPAKREAVEKLIDQELARQQAVLAKLDRSPQVVQAMEAARTEILARAYLRHVSSLQAAAPTDEEVRKYYAQHSELFSERRLYALDEISFPQREGLVAQLSPVVAKSRSLDEVAAWLRAREVTYTASRIGRPAEDLPLVMLTTLKEMKDGEMRVMDLGAGRVSVVRLVASKLAPVDEASAAPRIERFIANQRAGLVIAEELKRLRAQANIEYFGEFSASTPAAAPAALAAPAGGDEASTSVEKAVRALR